MPSGSHTQASLYERIYRQVSSIPAGRVSTYGRIAGAAGIPGHARQVGYALHRLKPGSEVPWHRVVNAAGMISLAPASHGYTIQRQLLESEGVRFDHRNVICLARYLWPPVDGCHRAESSGRG